MTPMHPESPSPAPFGGPRRHLLATFARRAAAAAIDLVIELTLLIIFTSIDARPEGWVYPFELLVLIGYYPFFCWWSGATPGQLLVGIRIVDADSGERQAFPPSLLRFAVLVLGTVVLVGPLWSLWDPRKQALHDKAAHSVVVRRLAPQSAGVIAAAPSEITPATVPN